MRASGREMAGDDAGAAAPGANAMNVNGMVLAPRSRVNGARGDAAPRPPQNA